MSHRSPRPSVAYLILSLAGSACLANLATAGLAQAQSSALPPDVNVVAAASLEKPQPRTAADLRTSTAATSAAPAAHANADHPAVVQSRRARAGQSSLDTNHFLVQPPATAQWALRSAP